MKFFSNIVESIAGGIMDWTARSGRTQTVVIDHELRGVAPDMITWWWDNIDTTERYKLWHPKDHISFEWVVPPKDGHVGAIQKVRERVAGISFTFLIRWEDPESISGDFQFTLSAAVIGNDGSVRSRLTHEYESAPYGTRMRSSFIVPASAPGFFVKGLKRHNREEMQCFCDFLPELYRQEVEKRGK